MKYMPQSVRGLQESESGVYFVKILSTGGKVLSIAGSSPFDRSLAEYFPKKRQKVEVLLCRGMARCIDLEIARLKAARSRKNHQISA